MVGAGQDGRWDPGLCGILLGRGSREGEEGTLLPHSHLRKEAHPCSPLGSSESLGAECQGHLFTRARPWNAETRVPVSSGNIGRVCACVQVWTSVCVYLAHVFRALRGGGQRWCMAECQVQYDPAVTDTRG